MDPNIEQLLPRYVLVKYATRGLVQEGRLSPLFSQLYALAATTFMSIHLIRCWWYHNSHLRNTVAADKNGTPVLVRVSAQAASNSNISEAIL